MPKKSAEGIVTFVIGAMPLANEEPRQHKIGIPNVTTEIRRMLALLGTLVKDGNHYTVEVDPMEEHTLYVGIRRRLYKHHGGCAPEKLSNASKNVAPSNQ